MTRLWAATLSLMTSLGLLGYWQSPDEPAPPRPPDPPKAKVVELKAAGAPADEDTAVVLNEAYDRLRRLRTERLDERSRELVDRATELYKDAIKAFNGPDPEHQRAARGLATAARELARAVERLRDVRLSDRPDPDLPPPPDVVKRFEADKATPKDAVSLPPIPPALEFGPPLPPVPPVPAIAHDPKAIELRAHVLRGPSDEKGTRPRVYVQTVPSPEGEKGARRFELRFDGDGLPEELRRHVNPERIEAEVREQMARVQEELARVREQAEQAKGEARAHAEQAKGEARAHAEQAKGEARAHAEQAAAEARARAEEVRARAKELREQIRDRVIVTGPGAVGGAFSIGGGPASARAALRQAYDRITEARETLARAEDQEAAEEAKFYLDAARDLYNAARRDAEAGRNERAAELARAAEALTHVPQHLPSLRDDQEDAEGDRDAAEVEGQAEDDEREVHRRELFRDREGEDVAPEQRRSEDVRVEENVERRVEGRADDQTEPDDEEEGPEEDEDQEREDVVGIGVALTFEEGQFRVLSIVPNSPAAKDGRLEEGDRLVGIVKEGEPVEFEGMDLEEVVGLIRGKEGTKVELIVQKQGEDGKTTIELTRERLEVPEPPRAERIEIRPFLDFDAVNQGFNPFEVEVEVESPDGELPPELPE